MQAFVIMPFGDDFDEVFKELIEPALADLGFTVTRADLSNNQEQILKDIINMIANADLVIADVSGLNGNVMYELGLAHAMGRKTAIITRSIDELPFDLRSYRVTGYKTSFTEAPALIKRLTEIGAGVIDGTATFGNPVQDFAPAFIGKSEQVTDIPSPSVDEAKSEVDADEDFGLLDWSEALATATEEVRLKSDPIAEATVEVGNRVEEHGAKIKKASEQLGSKAGPTLIKLMKDTAADMDSYSDVLEGTNPGLAAAVKELGRSTNGIASSRRATTDDERATMRSEIASIREAEESFAQAYGSIAGFGDIIAELPPMQQDMTRASRRAAKAVNETAGILDEGRSEFARARTLLEARLNE